MFCIFKNIKLKEGKYYASVYDIYAAITGLSESCLNKVCKEYIGEETEEIIIEDISSTLDYEIYTDLETLNIMSNKLVENLLEILKYKNDKRVPAESVRHVLYTNNVIDSDRILAKVTIIKEGVK